MDNTNPTSVNSGLTEGTYNIMDNIHNKNTTQRTKYETPVFLIGHPTCYSYLKSGPIQILLTIEE